MIVPEGNRFLSESHLQGIEAAIKTSLRKDVMVSFMKRFNEVRVVVSLKDTRGEHESYSVLNVLLSLLKPKKPFVALGFCFQGTLNHGQVMPCTSTW